MKKRIVSARSKVKPLGSEASRRVLGGLEKEWPDLPPKDPCRDPVKEPLPDYPKIPV